MAPRPSFSWFCEWSATDPDYGFGTDAGVTISTKLGLPPWTCMIATSFSPSMRMCDSEL